MSISQISTVSHLVALANQQHAVTKTSPSAPEQQQQQTEQHQHNYKDISNKNSGQIITTSDVAITTNITTIIENNKLPLPATTKVCIVVPNDSNGINTTLPVINGGTQTIGVVNGTAEVLEDPQLQQQLQQVHEETDTTITTSTIVGKTTGAPPPAACASNATTITSISALSPQTPTTAAITTNNVGDEQLHPLAPTASTPMTAPSSYQLTPTPKQKHSQQQQQPLSSIANPVHKVSKRKETLEAKRERKAAKTLAIITGAFVICWLPFFVMALLLPLCDTCEINDGIASVFLWLGYFNSTLNPVIYTIFSPEFRQAFKRILFGGHRPVHYRSGKI